MMGSTTIPCSECPRLRRLLEDKSIPVTESGCQIWIGATTKTGYGIIQFKENGQRKRMTAHRIAYLLAHGPLDEDLVIDHRCRVRSCINETHLRPLTNAANVLCGEGRSAHNRRKTYCLKGHALTGDNIDPTGIPSGRRWCLICRRERKRLWARKQARENSPPDGLTGTR
jgi:hypothetical protein